MCSRAACTLASHQGLGQTEVSFPLPTESDKARTLTIPETSVSMVRSSQKQK